MAKGPERRDDRITLRLPPTLRDAVEHLATVDGRSLSDFIVRTLQEKVDAQPRASVVLLPDQRKNSTRVQMKKKGPK